MEGPLSAPRIFTLCTIFGRMPGIEPELLRPQPGVLPMSYTHPEEKIIPWELGFSSLLFCGDARTFPSSYDNPCPCPQHALLFIWSTPWSNVINVIQPRSPPPDPHHDPHNDQSWTAVQQYFKNYSTVQYILILARVFSIFYSTFSNLYIGFISLVILAKIWGQKCILQISTQPWKWKIGEFLDLLFTISSLEICYFASKRKRNKLSVHCTKCTVSCTLKIFSIYLHPKLWLIN